MADNDEFKIKGAATARAEVTHTSSSPDEDNVSSAKPESSSPKPEPKLVLEEGEESPEEIKAAGMTEQDKAKTEQLQTEHDKTNTEQNDDLQRYRWCKCFCDPVQYNGVDHYFLHLDTQESRWEEPGEPYWIWDASKQALDEAGLQQPAPAAPTTSDEPDPNYYGYDPRIHGSYDPNAPYAQYHKQKREQEIAASQPASNIVQPGYEAAYGATATFNRFTGAFQTADKSMEQHDDYHKSGRQMGAFFDIDEAANAHGGRSLKEERRNQKLSKKEIKEMKEKRRERKEKKRLDFYKS